MARGKRAVAAPTESVEGPWELPEGWHWERLGDLGDWFGGGTPSKANPSFWSEGNIPWVSPKDMKTLFIEDSEDHISQAAIDGSSTKLVPSGSVLLVTRSGILKHSLPVAVNQRAVTLNQDMRALHPRKDILAGFVANYLRCSSQAILHSCVKDGTTVNSIETDRLMNWLVPIAPPGDQQAVLSRIDALFAEIDDADAALTEARAGVETYRKALLKAAVTGELTADWRRDNPNTETGEELLRRILADHRKKWDADPKNRDKRYDKPEGPYLVGLPDLPKGWAWASLDQLAKIDPRNGLSIKESTTPSPVRALGRGEELRFFLGFPIWRKSDSKLTEGDQRWIVMGFETISGNGSRISCPVGQRANAGRGRITASFSTRFCGWRVLGAVGVTCRNGLGITRR